MTPCVIIPTFWTRQRGRSSDRLTNVYDHPTPIDSDGTLPDCLRSLERVNGLGTVIVIVAATDASIEHRAEDRVRDILADFPGIDAIVFGPAEMGSLHRRLEQLEFADMIHGVSLVGYGAVRNVGLMAAAVLGCESIVFLDDDQIIIDDDYLQRAAYGIGEVTAKGRPVLAKTGYYVNAEGNARVPESRHWSDRFWDQASAYNQALKAITTSPRLKRSPMAFGGCLCLHRDMYCNVSFDPWVLRGEDIDYVINARMHGGDVFLDTEWPIIHQPPASGSEARQFRQDVYRFVYEQRKIEFAKSQVDLRQVSPDTLMPYPGQFVSPSVSWRATVTALLRALSRRDKSLYLSVARQVRREAAEYARKNCDSYFEFQRRWPIMMDLIWDDIALKPLLTGERRVDRTAITGRFPLVRE